jgi:HlyD family secretion protein
MSRTRLALVLLAIAVAALIWWIHRRNAAPPEVPFAKVRREKLASALASNGKAEPIEWAAVRAEAAGAVARVHVQRGQQVAQGAPIAELDARDARAALSSAEAAVAQARAQLATLTAGGTSTAKVEIANALERARLDLAVAQRNYESLRRLGEKQAATRQEIDEARAKVQQLEEEIQALERKRAALVSTTDREAAEARLREAQAAVEQARATLERTRIRAPMAGIVYDLPARVGAYVNPGDLVANVGVLAQMRVRVFVDEPELGRVSLGKPVTITWDAMPGRSWEGTVEKTPTQVTPLGTRQVGEVSCVVGNPDAALPPGANVNAEIISEVADNALTIPKEAIRRENNQTGVFVLRDDHVEFQPVELGASSVTRAAVRSGLRDGDLVALTTEVTLRSHAPVKAVVR